MAKNPINAGNTWLDNLVKSPGYMSFKNFMLKAAVIITVVALLLKYLAHLPGGTMLLICGMGTLGIMFFMMAYEVPEDIVDGGEAPLKQDFWLSRGVLCFTQKIWGWGLAVLDMGLLFRLCHWPGGRTMLVLGLVIFAIALAFKLISRSHRQNIKL